MSNTEQSASKFCTDCNRFYGNPANDNLCSTCFKKKMMNNSSVNSMVQQQQQQQQQQLQQSVQVKQPVVIEQPVVEKMQEEKNPQNNEPSKPKQDDHSRCWSCKKKVNLLGIKCKCEFTFCNKHRMPEDHACDYDHAQFGRELLKQNNPLVQKAKLEKI